MAKLEEHLQGDMDLFLEKLDETVLTKSFTATYEDGSDTVCGGVRCVVKVYERYAYFGNNRSSLNITVFGKKDDFCITAIASGGSEGVIFKINTWSEKSFLSTIEKLVEEFKVKKN